MAETTARDEKLVQYLTEAYGKEKQLETALQAHIEMAKSRAPYHKRLQQHLRETKNHSKQVERRIKQLGGTAESLSSTAQEFAQRAAAALTGPLHMVRGTGDQEKLLKNAKTEYQDEAEEIANYTAIITLSEAVGDKETAKVAKAILREEERMQQFLAKQIPQLTKAVVTAEIPARERATAGGRRRTTTRRRTTSSGGRTRSTSRSSSSRSTRSSGGRSGGSRSGGSSPAGGSRSAGSSS